MLVVQIPGFALAAPNTVHSSSVVQAAPHALDTDSEGKAASAPAASRAQTTKCNDGSAEGIPGYTAGSGCAKAIAAIKRRGCTATHSDEPGGTTDTLTTTCPKKRCYERDLVIQVFVPLDVTIPPFGRKKLKKVDLVAGRGWKIAQLELKQTVQVTGSKVTKANSTTKSELSATAGALGVTATAGTPVDNIISSETRARSTVQFNVTLTNPFGSWSPNTNYPAEIITNANGAPSAFSPNPGTANEPGKYVSQRQRLC